MRLLIVSVVMALFPAHTAFGQEVFGPWQVFPGPNPDVETLLPDVDSETAFRIGQIIFDYPIDTVSKIEAPVTRLSDLPSVAEIVKSTGGTSSLDALVTQQLSVPHVFSFERATVAEHGDAGLLWTVSHTLDPKEGGSSGVPYRYLTMADGRGKIIPPQLTVFDAFFHSAVEGWTCSTLRLSSSPPKPDATLSDVMIRDRATGHLEALYGRLSKGLQTSLQKRMEYRNQKQVRVPYATGSAGAIIYYDLWAVNFVDSARKNRPNEVFTIWVAADGRIAELRHLDREFTSDEQGVASEWR